MERHKFGFIEIRMEKLNDKFIKIEIDFKGKLIWSTCKVGAERDTICELLRELFDDEISSLREICSKYGIGLSDLFKSPAQAG
jgi:hypothetical protein